MPYTYILAFEDDTYYIGARTSKRAHSNAYYDQYFGSGTHIDRSLECVKYIIKEFDNVHDCLLHERELLLKYDAPRNPSFVNKKITSVAYNGTSEMAAIYSFVNSNGHKEVCSKRELQDKYSLHRGALSALCLGKLVMLRGWTLDACNMTVAANCTL